MNIDWLELNEEKKVMDLLDQIQEIRARNNKNWMGIMRLAFKHAPMEARALMRRITEADQEISKITKQLGEGDYGQEEKEAEGDSNSTSSAPGHEGSNFREGSSLEGISQE